VAVGFVATDQSGAEWWFDVAGSNTTYRGGMVRTDVVWRTIGRAAALRGARDGRPLVLLTTRLPRRPSEGDTAMRAAGPEVIFDAIELGASDDEARLARYAKGGSTEAAQPGFW
jgi:hypothetical protein